MKHIISSKSKTLRIISLFISIIIIYSIFVFSKSDDDITKSSLQKLNNNYSVYAIEIPDSLSFAGEEVPLMNFDTRESLDRELLVNTYFQSQTLLFIKRANRFLPQVEPILKDEDIPDDFKYLPFVESAYANPTSPSGAVGYWQFLKGTAKDYGLEVNSFVDERYNLEKSTKAACKYLKESYELYGSWSLAAASYNMGRNKLNKELERQKVSSYYDLLLNTETSRYVFRLLAIKTILENPGKYGFHFNEDDLYPNIPTYNVKIDSSITHFADFAKEYGINYKVLKIFNPWLRNHYLPNLDKKEYVIRIPKEGWRKFNN